MWMKNMQRKLVIVILLVIIYSSCENTINKPDENQDIWTFTVFSDIQQGYGVFSILSENIGDLEPTPLASFCCGDIMLHAANEVEWLSFEHVTEPIVRKMPLFIARGNHDGNDSVAEIMLHEYGHIRSDRFYYTHSEKNAFFLVLDTYERNKEGSVVGEQLDWLRHQLDSASSDSSISCIFIFMHQPLYPQGRHKGQNLSNADDLHQLFLQHKKIRAVFSGHDHMFNKYVKDSLCYVTTGGGGGVLYSGYGGDYHHFIKVLVYKNTSRIRVQTTDIFNEVIDDFDL